MIMIRSSQAKKEIISARCNIQAKEILNLLSRSENLSRSEIIAKSILEYYQRHFPDKSLREKEKKLFGRYGSRKGDLSINRKHYLKEILGGKHSHS
ncbi:MAG: transcriptional regulator [Elusimicrobia bacterium]|nr:transcriptional regulator [Elusimicrobiota bacterium]